LTDRCTDQLFIERAKTRLLGDWESHGVTTVIGKSLMAFQATEDLYEFSALWRRCYGVLLIVRQNVALKDTLPLLT
jgi:hypothetical protein